MNDNATVVMFVILLILMNVLFNGEPDLVDAIIAHLMKP